MKLVTQPKTPVMIRSYMKSSYRFKMDNEAGTQFQTNIIQYDHLGRCLTASDPNNYRHIAEQIRAVWRKNIKCGLDNITITANSRVTLTQGDEEESIPDVNYDFRLIVDKGRINSRYVEFILMLKGTKVLEWKELKTNELVTESIRIND